MNTPIITRQQLEIINRKTLRYPLQTAEKDYILALVMQIISDSPMGDKLVLREEQLYTTVIWNKAVFLKI